MKLIAILQARPSDITIRVLRIIFGLIILITIYFEFYKYNLAYPEFIVNNYQEILIKYSDYIKMGIVGIFGFVPVFMGITGICLLKKNKMRILQIIFGIILMVSSFYIIPENNINKNIDFTKENKENKENINKDETREGYSGEISFNDVINGDVTNINTDTQEEIISDYDIILSTLLFWLSFLPLFAGITGKCILKKCLKHGEKIVTIRV